MIFPLSRGKTQMGLSIVLDRDGKNRGVIESEALNDEIIKRVNLHEEILNLLKEVVHEDCGLMVSGQITEFFQRNGIEIPE